MTWFLGFQLPVGTEPYIAKYNENELSIQDVRRQGQEEGRTLERQDLVAYIKGIDKPTKQLKDLLAYLQGENNS
jgi:hypothetical protein